MAILWVIMAIILLFGFVVFFGAPYVPSKRRELEHIFKELYALDSHDTLVDMGSGDGVVLRVAANTGAAAIGYELNPALVIISRFLSRRSARVQVEGANLWRVHFPAATTVVYVFTVGRDVDKVARKMQVEANRLGHPLSLISYGWVIPHMTALKTIGAHHLYTFTPLQASQT